jgi:hypothetical protein
LPAQIVDDVYLLITLKSQEVENGAKISDEYILVQCKAVPENFSVYQTGHAIIQPKPQKELKRRKNVNVFMFLWDSTSRLNFIRQMPKSYKVLTKDLGAVYMKGMNKVTKILARKHKKRVRFVKGLSQILLEEKKLIFKPKISI